MISTPPVTKYISPVRRALRGLVADVLAVATFVFLLILLWGWS